MTIVRSEAGTVVFEKGEESPSNGFRDNVPGAARRQTVRIPLTNLEPGPYILSVEARSQLNGDLAAARHGPFHRDGGRDGTLERFPFPCST